MLQRLHVLHQQEVNRAVMPDTCPNCQGTLEPTQQGGVRDDSIEIRVMVPTCPKCGWSVTKLPE
jgi:RNase P subunit RPR2